MLVRLVLTQIATRKTLFKIFGGERKTYGYVSKD
nr:MAG TPA: hypothetical protein [Caudoviricetes sp.]